MKNSDAVSGRPKPKVLVCDPIHPDGIALLRKYADVDVIEGPKLDVATLEAKMDQYHGVINRSRTALPASVIQQGKHLRVIVRAGSGLDNVAVETARAQNIHIANCPGVNTVAVAEHTFALMLGLSRHLVQADGSLKTGKWLKSDLVGTELNGKTLGIVGFGNIGREVARRATAFGMNVLVNQNRFTPALAREWRVENVDLLELLAASDYVTLHVPLRPANAGMIGFKEMSHMKPTAYLINTSRGGIVDEKALLQALREQKISGAAIDVFENEPDIFRPLAQHPNVLATPHIGASTKDAQRNVSIMAAQKVIDVLQERGPAEALSLRVVAVDQLHPHEEYHEPRVERLAQRLDEDGVLSNPPLVAELPGRKGYVVLDGATRTTAFQKKEYPHIIVQVVDVNRDVQLHSWRHAVRDVHGRGGARGLLALLHTIEGIRLVETPICDLNEAILVEGALCYVVISEQHAYLVEIDEAIVAAGEADWLDLLTGVVQSYGKWGDVERTSVQEFDKLQAMYSDVAALFVYPTFTAEIVLQIAAQGRLLPAGITRFIVPGRILRLNAPLHILRSDVDLVSKQDWLDRFIESKLSDRHVRYYQEPVLLLDD